MRILSFIFLLAFGAFCSSQKDTDNSTISKDALMDEVMQLHDEAMIPWAEIHELKKQLESKIEKSDSLQASAPTSQKYQQLSQSLKEADAAMMEWMRAFHPNELQAMPADSAIALLQQKKASMQEVYDQVHSSVDSAKALLGTE